LAIASQGKPASQSDITSVKRAHAILQAKCLSCHGGANPQGGINLAARDKAIGKAGSRAALIPGDPTKSPLIAAVRGIGKIKMPPGGHLSADEISTLESWVRDGAKWPETKSDPGGLWSLRPVTSPKLPVVKNAAWVRNPIDRFILSALEKKGLSPAPEADRRTLIRRAYYDLIGVPPTPAETNAFLADKQPNAYERVVDRLLADPRYGERWARHWLDCARFAESQGFERDIIRDHAWRYRDYVISSLNADKPYDQFVKEQIAGDVLKPDTRDGRVATSFLVAGPWDEAASGSVSVSLKSIAREDELEDTIGVVGQTFLGLTVNCARCHDHKFDPIPQRDYYRLRSALSGVRHGNRPILTSEEELARKTRSEALRASIARTSAELAEIERNARKAALSWPKQVPLPLAQWSFDAGARDVAGQYHLDLVDGAKVEQGKLILQGGKAFARSVPLALPLREKTLEAWVLLPDLNQRGGAVLSVGTGDGRFFDAIVYGERQPGKWIAGSDGFGRTRDLDAPKENARNGVLTHIAVAYRPDGTIQVYRNGVPYGAAYQPRAGLRTFEAGKDRLYLGLRHVGGGNAFLACEIDEARVYDRALTGVEVAASYEDGIRNLSPEQLQQNVAQSDKRRYATLLEQAKLLNAELAASAAPPLAYSGLPEQPPITHLLARGDYTQPGEELSAGGLSCVAMPSADFGLAPNAPEAERRIDLANWIANPKNPLTARVMVNRVWHYHFGRGIVATPNDFGANGEKPTHPELLDWLAATFVARDEGEGMRDETSRKRAPSLIPHPSSLKLGWSMKALHRLIVTSATYRQASTMNATAAKVDADDTLHWRFPPRRLEAEAVRDAMLCAGGNINWERGGPGFRPFTIFVDNSHFYRPTDLDEPQYRRRSIYRITVNSARSTLLDSFDCPDPSTKTPVRASTTTPLQALAMMNDTFVIRQSNRLAERVQKEAGSDAAKQVSLAFQIAFGRTPMKNELDGALQLVKGGKLQSLCWALLNSNEFVTVR
jgi:hypothetical protein